METLVLNELFFLDILSYVGHPISSDNGLISQKPLLKSELYYPFDVSLSVAYSCLKYGVFYHNLSRSDDNNTLGAHGHENHVFFLSKFFAPRVS